MIQRVEFETPFFVGIDPSVPDSGRSVDSVGGGAIADVPVAEATGLSEGHLFVSSGPSDDYVELVWPVESAASDAALAALRALADATLGDDLDLRFPEGDPPTVCVLALHVDLERRALPYRARVARVLARLAGAAPALDFGDLVPAELLAEIRPASLPVPGENAAPFTPVLDEVDSRDVLDGSPAVASQALGDRAPEAATDPSSVDHRPVVLRREPAPRSRLVAELLGRAGELAARGRVHKALRAVDDALRRDPSDLEGWNLREELMLLEKRERRRQREPRDAQAQLEVGFSYLVLGCDGDAVEALRLATRLKPDLFVAHVVLGLALHHQRDSDEASRAYERAARLRPRDPAPRDLLRSLRRGEPPPRPVESRPSVRARFQQLASAV